MTVNSVKELKQVLSAEQVAKHYLGYPTKTSGGNTWYCSPFRREKVASLCINNRGFYDFGTSTHYDIIKFIQSYFNVDFKQALDIIKNDFGFSINKNEYETDDIMKLRKKQKEEEQMIINTIVKWHNETYNILCDKWKEWTDIVCILDGYMWLESYAIALNKQCYYEYLIEIFREARTNEEKSTLYKERSKIQCYL